MSKEQTAVEYMVSKLIALGYLHSEGYGQSHAVTILIQQAKEMEKEQIDDLEYCIFIIDTKVDDFTLLQSDIERLNKMRDTYGE